jgi:hypothetical protein
MLLIAKYHMSRGQGAGNRAQKYRKQVLRCTRNDGRMLVDQESGGDGEEKYDGDDAVHGEEGGVHAGEVVGRDDAVFVE